MPREDVLLRVEFKGNFGNFREFLEENNFDDNKTEFGIIDSDDEQIFGMEVESEDNFTASGMELVGNKHWSVDNPRVIRDWFAENAKLNGCELASFFIREVSEEMGGIFRYWVWPFPDAVADFFWNGWVRPWEDEDLCDKDVDADELNERKAEYEEAKKNFTQRLADGEVLGLYIDQEEVCFAAETEGLNDAAERFDEALQNIMNGKHADASVYYIELDGNDVSDEDTIDFDEE